MIPLCFEYLSDEFTEEIIYVTIVGQVTHHFTGRPVYRVREEYPYGRVNETFYTEARMDAALRNRVTG